MSAREERIENAIARALAMRIDKVYADLQALESDCEEIGWRSVSQDIYGARLRVSDARETVRGWGVQHKSVAPKDDAG
jgi:hypothetical protein